MEKKMRKLSRFVLVATFVVLLPYSIVYGDGIPDEKPISGVVKFNPADFNHEGFEQLEEVRLFSNIGPNIQTNQDNSGNAQNETSIARNPLNPYNLVGGANDYRNGEVDGGFYYTFDGGQTWGDGTLCCWPQLDAQGDPAVTCDADGNFYFAVISFDRNTPDNGIYVSKSEDGGISWGNPVAVVEHIGDPGAPFEDKEYIAADVTDSPYRNNVYVTWTRFGWDYPIMISRSIDQGATYSAPMEISDYNYCQGSVPAVGPDGEVYVTWLAYSSPYTIRLVKSTNGGVSFGSEIIVAEITGLPSPLPPTDFRVNSFPSIAVDHSGGSTNGYIHIVWGDYRNGDADVYYSKSTDGGSNWSTAVRINDGSIGDDNDQFFPWVSCDPDGYVHVFFYDRRDDPSNIDFHGYYTRSEDGGDTWTANERVTTAPSDPYTDFSGGFIGDYNGITAVGHRAHPLWTDTRNGGQDIFTAQVDWGTVPSVSIGVTPENTPIEIPPDGGSFTYTGILGNNYDSPVTVDVWLMIDVPGYGYYGPVRRFNNIPVNGFEILTAPGGVQNVPPYAPAGEYRYWAFAGDYPDDVIDSVAFGFTKSGSVASGEGSGWELTGWFMADDDRVNAVPESKKLLSNYPNPFNALTEISYAIGEEGNVSIEIFNLMGRKIETLVNRHQQPGAYSVRWDAQNYASGVYFYKLQIGDEAIIKRMTLLK
ncbi:MAG: T9SS type A sorting domain-containing protein [candidate division Zixibacteria bacterium]|nr:T9SS type A sorting domain-containing protein [candidate division Zixibacteria bacterium]